MRRAGYIFNETNSLGPAFPPARDIATHTGAKEMKRTLMFVLALLIVLPAGAVAETRYGAGVRLEKGVSVSDIFARPAVYSGKTVKVKGLVVDVCTARGCWLDLAGDKPHEKIRVKVEDGAIVFPASARGRQATVQGVVETMKMCPDEARRFREAEAKAKGVPFDPASITGKESSLAIRATGAVVE